MGKMKSQILFVVLLCAVFLSSSLGNPTKTPKKKWTKGIGNSTASPSGKETVTEITDDVTESAGQVTATPSSGDVTVTANPNAGTVLPSGNVTATATANAGTALPSGNVTAMASENANAGTASLTDNVTANTPSAGDTTEKAKKMSDTLQMFYQLSDDIPECEFLFDDLPQARNKQDLWENTLARSEKDLAKLNESSIEYRIATPSSFEEQPDLYKYYEESSEAFPTIEDIRHDEFLAADNELADEKFMDTVKLVYKEKPKALGYLEKTALSPNQLAPFFRRNIRLMKHRFCLFSLVIKLRDTNNSTYMFMPGFIGYNKEAAIMFENFFKAQQKGSATQEMLEENIIAEFDLSKQNRSSSVSLHGNLFGPDEKPVYFSIWTKNPPGSFDNCFVNANASTENDTTTKSENTTVKSDSSTTKDGITAIDSSTTKDGITAKNSTENSEGKTKQSPIEVAETTSGNVTATPIPE